MLVDKSKHEQIFTSFSMPGLSRKIAPTLMIALKQAHSRWLIRRSVKELVAGISASGFPANSLTLRRLQCQPKRLSEGAKYHSLLMLGNCKAYRRGYIAVRDGRSIP